MLGEPLFTTSFLLLLIIEEFLNTDWQDRRKKFIPLLYYALYVYIYIFLVEQCKLWMYALYATHTRWQNWGECTIYSLMHLASVIELVSFCIPITKLITKNDNIYRQIPHVKERFILRPLFPSNSHTLY